MIPDAGLEVSSDLPLEARFWVPTEDDLDEEGIGWFRGTWLIVDVTREEAAEIAHDEARLADAADLLAVDAIKFDRIARSIESRDPEAIPRNLADNPIFPILRDDRYGDDSDPLAGVDLGVSGLVHALAAIGCFPAASCRGHVGAHAWSPHPVVIFATDRRRAEAIQPFVDRARCGFTIDTERPELLVIEATSITDTMSLADQILHHYDTIAKNVTGSQFRTRPYFNSGQLPLSGM